jgi:hypothetical protein
MKRSVNFRGSRATQIKHNTPLNLLKLLKSLKLTHEEAKQFLENMADPEARGKR